MSTRVALQHSTTYSFDRLVRLSPHVVRLRPAPHCRTPVLSYSLSVTPGDHFINWQQDPFGNHVARLVFPAPARRLTVTVDLVADLVVINPFDFFVEESAARYPFAYDADLARELAAYLGAEEPSPLLAQWLHDCSRGPTWPGGDGQGIVDFLVSLNQLVFGAVAYTTRMEAGVQTPDETLEKGLGSCRDSAWLLVQILRRLGVAARFVSGYLVQLRADEAPIDGPAGPPADFTDLHAWAEAYLPGAGWVGLDPTSGLLAGEGHLPLVCSPHPAAAAPISGATDPCEVTLEFSNTVRRLSGPPRVTLPYSDEQWAGIDALGQEVDRALVAGDVRLTLGGEPTFVATDDMEAAEWTTAADGLEKRARGEALAWRLMQRFAPGGLIHHGQGKWYPGEPLPRWQIALLWRADGEPLWEDRNLLAPAVLAGPSAPGPDSPPGPESPSRPDGSPRPDSPSRPDGPPGPGHAAALAGAIAAALGLPEGCCIPGYEDPLQRLLVEALLPGGEPPVTDVAPTGPGLASSESRLAALASLDALGRGDPAGWVIPLHPVNGAATGGDPGDQPGWETTRWTLRRGHLALVPGDSPMGLRLPLEALTWRPPPPDDPETSPFEEPSPLPGRKPRRRRPKMKQVEPEEVPRGALCVEVRQGHVFVFLPPVQRLEHFVDLVGVVEGAAARLHLPVVLEGYLPPVDRRLVRLLVTPDPGVLEVNVHPSSSWPELVDITTVVYSEARATRLGTETFHLDGAHAGTGGGNHMTLGGPTPADSPLLRRPDLLRSITTYWQHHPSLSYVFSGRFIGPTSQAPRVDEARHESLYELEIAFAELERWGLGSGAETPHGTPAAESAVAGSAPPWLVDRLFRHLLVDITGSAHRAELCIDKLFSPDSERGRLGLLELRGFEMPPHPRMALVQALLVRALVARFWAAPYTGPLVRWGTELHDRFLLPWYAAADLEEVVGDLSRHGFGFDPAWLAPFLEFRFPRLGSVEVAGVTLELRAAIEPWSVLGEEVTSTGTARYVDSSLERLQVSIDGLTSERHVVTCNGVPVPLHSTGTPGAYVAGVRYRAWKPPSALHPTIGVHAPLVFDLVDRWNSRSLGGCTYHVTHPGGRAYDRFPVNANEAEARRASRFFAGGHTPGPVDVDALLGASRHGGGATAPGPGLSLDPRSTALPGPRRARRYTGYCHLVTIAPPPDLVASYRQVPGTYDEMVTADGRVREHWAHAGRVIGNLGLDELLYRRSEARRLLDDDGVTYNVYGDDAPSDVPGPVPAVAAWALDPVPVLLASDEWADVELGVVQRAELLNLVLTDLYGPRQLLRRGVLPAALVLGHSGFLRACDQIRVPGSQQLFTVAVDLARDASGRCTVLADYTQAPSGAGYALENRVVVSRVFPSLYRDSQVHRLAPFFRTLRASLQAVAPPDADDPRIVLLSPGPWSETAFEHAYLASHLGYPLVEGADLTVRDGRVWMRSLRRLERVDVILRRTDAWFCDPLELRSDSRLGVPGLVEAARRGGVSIVNTLGSGVLENPGLLPYLPRLAEHLLGEQLLLPSVPTWWCGDEQSRRHVVSHLDSLVIKPIARGAGPTAVFPWELTSSRRDELRRQIEAQPGAWVGQETVELASTPTLTPTGLEARPTVLRTFVVARQDSYAAMPGGLTRVAGSGGSTGENTSTRSPRISNQAGAISKDTWVLASEPEKLSGFWLVPGPPVVAVDPEASMSSRAAENLFWMGRYAERAESMARLVRAAHDRRNDFQRGGNPAGTECLQVLLTALTQVSATYPGFVGEGAAARLAAPGAELFALVVDERRPGTLAHAVRRLVGAAQAVRDQLSSDTWMAVGTLERELGALRTSDPDHLMVIQHSLGRIVQGLLALSGLFAEAMERDPGWRFMDAGRRLERGQQLVALLRSTVTLERSTATDSLLLESVLIAAESIITYRRRYRSQAQLGTLLDLLLTDPDNPRSLANQLDQLAVDVHLMSRLGRGPRLSEPERLVLEASTALRLADTVVLARSRPDGTHPQLDAFLSRTLELLYATANAIDRDHFVHLLTQRSLLGS